MMDFHLKLSNPNILYHNIPISMLNYLYNFLNLFFDFHLKDFKLLLKRFLFVRAGIKKLS